MATWTCPDCNRSFGAPGRQHMCRPGQTIDEFLEGTAPYVGPILLAVRDHLVAVNNGMNNGKNNEMNNEMVGENATDAKAGERAGEKADDVAAGDDVVAGDEVVAGDDVVAGDIAGDIAGDGTSGTAGDGTRGTAGDLIVDPLTSKVLFKNGPTFCTVEPKKRWVAVGMSLRRPLATSRTSRKIVEYNGRYYHVFNIDDVALIDDEFRSWLTEAYHVGTGTYCAGTGTCGGTGSRSTGESAPSGNDPMVPDDIDFEIAPPP